MVLASTGQTPSGFVPASFGGPLGLFDSSAISAMNDVVSIGNGPSDAKELANLLKSAGPMPSTASMPLQATFTPGAVPNTAGLSVTPAPGVASATTDKQSLPVKPVLDSQGRVDCSKAVSCQTDPTTNVTTVTYPDGVVAFVQQINDLTLVAYKTVGQAIQDGISSILPKPVVPLPAAAAPAAPAPVPVVVAPAPEPVPVKTPSIDARPDPSPVEAGPVAPSAPAAPDISAATVRPQLTISNDSADFGQDQAGPTGGSAGNPGAALGAVKDAVGSVVDAVTGAVGKAIGPGAVTEKPDTSSPTSSSSSDSGSDSKSGGSSESGGSEK